MMASPIDLERGEKSSPEPVQVTTATSSRASISISTTPLTESPVLDALRRINNRIEGLSGFEARGITRVLPEERKPASALADLQVFLFWFGANISANNMTTGLFGPLIFNLGFRDSVLCAVFGCFLGSASTAYMAMWGPCSGNRTMVVLRFFMGYWPSKFPCFLNLVLLVGYLTLNFIISGQILSAVSGGTMTIAVGIVIVTVVCWGVAVFGMFIFHAYERYAWIPQILVLFVLIGCAGPHFDSTLESAGDAATLAANRLSFLSLCFYVPNSWAATASDFYVYYPETTSKLKIFLLTLAGLFISFTLVYLLGIGLASGVGSNPAWAEAFAISTGSLIVGAFDGLADFGKFCGVIVALGLIANSIPGAYAAALDVQVLGRYGQAVPRWVWTSIIVVIELVLALAGRDNLLVIFGNFLALMGYWIEIMIVIVLEEHLLFRWNRGFEWAKWEDKEHLPLGISALISFLAGWVGAILGMYQHLLEMGLPIIVTRLALAGSKDVDAQPHGQQQMVNTQNHNALSSLVVLSVRKALH
ncbi:permease for cytosine/purines, uracil, thiamine, allantoin-domain-containing protein [Parachaetomium inaequale]|uniref:Permease for cytosine/purines, uracil, thiamine, allantoin-domain-containing protein n=1 Tax=Parachaetomium inaequale TaxID=2588326 RepID=A0AAN6SNA7_9PEZI|nr:permease for cytosine/purines, uracil, thiamine, allantoin-domain-containing protein [Parachaetomium inaequale]